MKTKLTLIKWAALLVLLATLNAQLSTAFAQGTAFAYQGQLQNNGSPASGTYNLTFSLFNTNTSGVAIAGPVTNSAVSITNGLFTVLIDFGPGVFTGETNWLQIGVESNGVSGFTTLAPRQELTPTPNAIYAESANTLSGTLSASQLTSIGNTNGGSGNFFVGGSGNATTGGFDNTANGVFALNANTSGSDNVANGVGALFLNTSGSGNTADGMDALVGNRSGSENTAIGFAALYFNTIGSENTAIGVGALEDNTNGYFNTANGVQALYSNTSGSGNTANGVTALLFNTTGSENVAEGLGALQNNTNDNELVAIGYQALQNDNAYGNGFTLNGENTGIGYQALQLTTFGYANTAIGYQALNQNTNGSQNTANGDFALFSNTSGSDNTAIGIVALYSNTSGSENTANGDWALFANTNGSGNIAIGSNAGNNLQNGNYNIYIGNQGIATESGIIRIGMAGSQTATYLTGNVSIGGASPGQELSINGGMDVDAAASDNGTVNNAWTLLFGGATAGEGIGSVRVAGYGDSYGLNFYTDYNKRMTILQNGHVGIGTTNATQLLVVGSGGAYCNGTTWVNGSDRNSKEDFSAINPRTVLAKVSALPITEWQYKVDADGTQHLGPMAQDFHAAFGLNGTDDKHIATVDEEGVALAAIQGLNQKLTEKDAEIQELKARLDKLEQLIAAKSGGAK